MGGDPLPGFPADPDYHVRKAFMKGGNMVNTFFGLGRLVAQPEVKESETALEPIYYEESDNVEGFEEAKEIEENKDISEKFEEPKISDKRKTKESKNSEVVEITDEPELIKISDVAKEPEIVEKTDEPELIKISDVADPIIIFGSTT